MDHNHWWISKCFTKGCELKFLKDVFLVKNVIEDIKGENVMETFYKKKLQNSSQTEFRIERVLGRKEKKLYFRCKGYENSFKS